MPRKQRRRFSREFKVEAVALASREGVSIGQVAEDLGVGENMLRRWKKQYELDSAHAFGGSGRILPRELVRVKRERDFLKSAAVFFAKESK